MTLQEEMMASFVHGEIDGDLVDRLYDEEMDGRAVNS